MPLQIFNSDWIGNGLRADLTDVDDMYVAEGVIVGREDAISGSDLTVSGTGANHLVHVDGRVMGGGTVIALGDQATGDFSNKVVIGETGTVHCMMNAGSGAAIRLVGHSSSVENAGTILSTFVGISVVPQAASGSSEVINSGSILTEGTAIIRAGGTQKLVVTNSGVISSDGTAFTSSGNAVDQIFNTGRIDGSIEFGSGDDLYDGRGGTLAGFILAGDGNDTLFGGNNADTFFAGPGNDDMRGGGGNDFYDCDSAGDSVIELAGQGIDLIHSTVSRTLGANIENLTLQGIAASIGVGNALANGLKGDGQQNRFHGLAGNDQLYGFGGNDFLTGGVGADRLTGGTQADRFIFNSVFESRIASGRDVIIDFTRAQGDKIDLHLIDGNLKAAGNNAFTFIGTKAFSGKAGELRFQTIGTDTHISGDFNGDKIADLAIISDVAMTFIKSDFIL